jgi:hypothetical protein
MTEIPVLILGIVAITAACIGMLIVGSRLNR